MEVLIIAAIVVALFWYVNERLRRTNTFTKEEREEIENEAKKLEDTNDFRKM